MKFLTVSQVEELQIEDLNRMMKLVVFAPNESVKSAISKRHKRITDE